MYIHRACGPLVVVTTMVVVVTQVRCAGGAWCGYNAVYQYFNLTSSLPWPMMEGTRPRRGHDELEVEMFDHEARGHGRPLDNAYDVVWGTDEVGHAVGCHCVGCLGFIPDPAHSVGDEYDGCVCRSCRTTREVGR